MMVSDKEYDDLEVLATFVHGALFSFHLLGLFHNLRRRNWLDAAAHGLGALYDGAAARKHYKYMKGTG